MAKVGLRDAAEPVEPFDDDDLRLGRAMADLARDECPVPSLPVEHAVDWIGVGLVDAERRPVDALKALMLRRGRKVSETGVNTPTLPTEGARNGSRSPSGRRRLRRSGRRPGEGLLAEEDMVGTDVRADNPAEAADHTEQVLAWGQLEADEWNVAALIARALIAPATTGGSRGAGGALGGTIGALGSIIPVFVAIRPCLESPRGDHQYR